jgi:hypothetical protein
MGLKEKAVASILLMLALYAAAVATWFLHSEGAWKKAASKYKSACQTYKKEVETIANKDRYVEDYEQAKAFMPSFEANKTTEATWLKKMREIALKNLIIISQDEAKSEIVGDDVHELPIEVRSWEGSLEALVKFMYELENTDEGMFAITELNFRPSSKKGYLRGSFTLNCAYMRED